MTQSLHKGRMAKRVSTAEIAEVFDSEISSVVISAYSAVNHWRSMR